MDLYKMPAESDSQINEINKNEINKNPYSMVKYVKSPKHDRN